MMSQMDLVVGSDVVVGNLLPTVVDPDHGSTDPQQLTDADVYRLLQKELENIPTADEVVHNHPHQKGTLLVDYQQLYPESQPMSNGNSGRSDAMVVVNDADEEAMRFVTAASSFNTPPITNTDVLLQQQQQHQILTTIVFDQSTPAAPVTTVKKPVYQFAEFDTDHHETTTATTTTTMTTTAIETATATTSLLDSQRDASDSSSDSDDSEDDSDDDDDDDSSGSGSDTGDEERQSHLDRQPMSQMQQQDVLVLEPGDKVEYEVGSLFTSSTSCEPSRRSARKVPEFQIKSMVALLNPGPTAAKARRPKSIKAPTRVPAKFDRVHRRPVSTRTDAVCFPTIRFADHITEHSHDEHGVLQYMSSLDLRCIQSIVKERNLTNIRVAPCRAGAVLRTMSISYLNDLKFVHRVTNNMYLDLGVYHLMYGAIPRKMLNAAVLFLIFTNKEYNAATADKTAEQKKRLAYMYDGDLELLCYIYWELSTQDLIAWKNDVPRKVAKQALAAAWATLPEGEKKNSICALAQFEDNDYITASCLLYIKMHFNGDMVGNEDNRRKWETFMRLCGIHHFSCSHTLYEVHRRLNPTRDMMLARYDQISAQDREHVAFILSTNEIFRIFKTNNLLSSEAQVHGAFQKLLNNLVYWLIRKFALHLIVSAIYPSKEITEKYLPGFVKYNWSLVLNNLPRMLPDFSTRVANKVQKILLNVLRVEYHTSTDNTTKIRTTTAQALLDFIRQAIETAIYPCVYAKQVNATNLANCLHEYLNKHSVEWRDADSWIITDDVPQDNDEYTERDYRTDESSDSSSDESSSSDEDDDEEETDYYDDEEIVEDEVRNLLNDRMPEFKDPTESAANAAVTTRKSRAKSAVAASASSSSSSSTTTAAAATTTANLSTETKFPLYERAVPRIKCTLCDGITTTKAVILEKDVAIVASCLPCILALNREPDDKTQEIRKCLVQRTGFKYQPPIAYRLSDNNERRFIPVSFDLLCLSFSYEWFLISFPLFVFAQDSEFDTANIKRYTYNVVEKERRTKRKAETATTGGGTKKNKKAPVSDEFVVDQ